MLRGSINRVFHVRVGPEDHNHIQGTIAGTARNLRYNQSMAKFVLGGSQGCLSMITQFIEGQRWYFTS